MAYLSYIFNYKRNPSLEAAERISDALNMTLQGFLIGLRGRAGKDGMQRHTSHRELIVRAIRENQKRREGEPLKDKNGELIKDEDEVEVA